MISTTIRDRLHPPNRDPFEPFILRASSGQTSSQRSLVLRPRHESIDFPVWMQDSTRNPGAAWRTVATPAPPPANPHE